MLLQGGMLLLVVVGFFFPSVFSSLASAQHMCSSALLFQLPPHLNPPHMKAGSTGSCCHIPCHPLLRDWDLSSASPDTTPPTPRPSLPELSRCVSGGSGWNLTFELHLRTDSFGSLLSSGVETAVPLLRLHYPDRLFMLSALPRARCSFWMLSSFSVIPVPPLPPPTPPPVSGNYSFGAFNQPSHTAVDRSCSSLVAHLSSSCTHSWHIPKSTKSNSSLHAHCT